MFTCLFRRIVNRNAVYSPYSGRMMTKILRPSPGRPFIAPRRSSTHSSDYFAYCRMLSSDGHAACAKSVGAVAATVGVRGDLALDFLAAREPSRIQWPLPIGHVFVDFDETITSEVGNPLHFVRPKCAPRSDLAFRARTRRESWGTWPSWLQTAGRTRKSRSSGHTSSITMRANTAPSWRPAPWLPGAPESRPPRRSTPLGWPSTFPLPMPLTGGWSSSYRTRGLSGASQGRCSRIMPQRGSMSGRGPSRRAPALSRLPVCRCHLLS